MADLGDRHLVDAGLALLRADSGLVVWPDAAGAVPTTPVPPYVRVHYAVERPAGGEGCALDGRSAAWTVRWWCHSVGASEDAVLAVAVRVRAALLDVSPVVTGLSCCRIRQEAAQPPSRDTGVTTPVWEQTTVYRLDATTAS